MIILTSNLPKTQTWNPELDSNPNTNSQIDTQASLFLPHVDPSALIFFLQCGIWLRLMTHVTFLFYFDACCLCYTQTPQLLWFPQPENIVLALKVNCMPTVCLKSALSAHPWCRSVIVFRWIVLSVSRLSYLIFPLSDVKVIYNVLKDHDPWKLINKWPEPVV